ncbi:MAG TPA: hypothetical protein VKX17_06605 [Planctomycetota bacterium]|nr:hypothetical protein [Planctomycetota bacterium]
MCPKTIWQTSAGLILCVAVPTLAGEPRGAPAPVQSMATETFFERIGINVQLGLPRSSYARYADVVKPRLHELGLRYLRDAVSADRSDQLAKLKDLAAAGYRFGLVMKPIEAVDLCKTLSDSVVFAEPPDEPDRGGESWPDVARANQKALFQALKANPATKRVQVMAPGLRDPIASHVKLGNLVDFCEFGTIRVFPRGLPNAGSSGLTLGKQNQEVQRTSGNKGVIISEAGYHNCLEAVDPPGVPESVAAKYLPRMLLTQFSLSYFTFLFELLDSEADPKMTSAEKHFGLLHADGSPKPAFIAMKKLVEFMHDPGPTFLPETLAYKVEVPPKDLSQLLLEKRDGTFYLCLWQEALSYDPKQRREIAVAPHDVTIVVGPALASASYFYPLREGDRPRPIADLQKIRVPVTDEIVVVALKKK